MRYFVWFLRLVVFVVVLLFAKNNATPVDVNFYADYALTGVPLVVVILISIVLGLLLGLLLVSRGTFRRKREVASLKKEVVRLQQQLENAQSTQQQSIAPEAVVPLAPL